MDGNNHYIRVDANNFVIQAFSDAFEQPESTDILIASDRGRHYNPKLFDDYGNPIYKWDGTQLVDRTQDADYLLTVAKAAKLAELEAACFSALSSFTSSALGTPHTYLTGYGNGNTDFLMLETEDRYMQSADYDGNPILWYTVDAGDLEHDKAQIHQVYLDGRASGQTAKLKMKQLAATLFDPTTDTVAKVQAIVW